MFKKIKDYFKNATFKGVVKDLIKVLRDFFAWRFSMITIGGLASIMVYFGVSKFLSKFFGFIFIVYFVIALVATLVKIHKEKG